MSILLPSSTVFIKGKFNEVVEGGGHPPIGIWPSHQPKGPPFGIILLHPF